MQPLSKEEEEFYLQKYFDGDNNAREVLIERNLRLVAHIAKKYSNLNMYEQEEMISIGTIGLIKGVNTFKKDKNTKLSTYISRCIENEILMSLRSSKKYKQDVSLQEPIGVDKEGNQICIVDKISDDKKNTEDIVEMKIQIEKLIENLESLLTEMELDIIKKRYEIGYERKTQQQIADENGICRAYVSKIEKRAIEKLHDFLEK